MILGYGLQLLVWHFTLLFAPSDGILGPHCR